jgi:hypothetical protein
MVPHDASPRLLRVSELDTAGARQLQRRHRAGELVRVRRGVYVAAERWHRLDARERHVLAVRAVLPELAAGTMVSHLSAAALLGWPHIGRWPERVHVLHPTAARDDHPAGLAVHHRVALRAPSTEDVHGVGIVSALDTAIMLARSLPFVQAVVLLDHLARTGAVTKDELEAALPPRPERGSVRAARAVDLIDPRRESVGESFSAARFEEVGAPRPVPQQEFRQPDGTVDRVDFWFPEQGMVIEFDGRQKYEDPAMLAGRDPRDVLWDEKRRADRVLAQDGVAGLGRIVWYDLLDPDRVRTVLRRLGIPCS